MPLQTVLRLTNRKLNSRYISVCLLTLVVLVCFGRMLGSYFVADDFSQISYVWSIFQGNWGALLSTFTGNYLQIPVMKIYRPCLLLSLVFDYAIWHTNAFGYFLTNILLMAASAVMFFFLLREMTKSWEKKRSLLFALLSAALFASNPLHCESISFISGRDNLISAFFYLLSLWCFIKSSASKKLVALGVVSFWIALLSKETAIGLPAVLLGIAFIFPEIFKSPMSTTIEQTASARLRFAFGVSCPLWLSAVVYFGIRFLALGTMTGGYTGGIGAGLMRHAIERWTNLDTICRIAYPLNIEVFGTHSAYNSILFGLYTVLATLVLLRFLGREVPLRWLGFWLFWTLTTAAPLYQMWSLSENLAGARIFFFLSLPLSMLIPLLLLAPAEGVRRNEGNLERNEMLGIAALLALVVVCTSVTYQNNLPWVHAGKETRACLREGERLAVALPPGKKYALLGLPMENAGAHAIYNGPTFNVMMSQPFSNTDCADRFVLFHPLFFGPGQLISAQRLKRVLADSDVAGLFVWNEKTLTFDRLALPSREAIEGRTSATSVEIEKTSALIATSASIPINKSERFVGLQGSNLLSAPSYVDPYRYDFLELALKGALPKEPVFVLWKGKGDDWFDFKDPAHAVSTDATKGAKVRVRLSDHWRWFTQGDISQLRVEYLPGQSIELSNVRLVPNHGLVPNVAVVNAQASNLGIYTAGAEGISLDIDGSAIPGCKTLRVELSKPNYFFEGLSEDESKDAVMTTLTQPSRNGRIKVDSKLFTSSGYYELRVGCLDDKGAEIGEKSDPVTISI
jgi:hypothetical protein